MEKRFLFRYRNTIATVIAEEKFLDCIKKEMIRQYEYISSYIRKRPEFFKSFSPLPHDFDAPLIVQKMYQASNSAKVGPMAAVAGAIAQAGVEAALKEGAQHVIVDNGGDIAFKISRKILVGIYSPDPNQKSFAFEIKPSEDIQAICSSSGVLGHSFSYGNADCVSVFSSDAAKADAFATAICNRVNRNYPKSISGAINDFIKCDIKGVLVLAGVNIGLAGILPPLVEANINRCKISTL